MCPKGRVGSSPTLTITLGGGIGIRSGLKSRGRKACGFESHPKDNYRYANLAKRRASEARESVSSILTLWILCCLVTEWSKVVVCKITVEKSPSQVRILQIALKIWKRRLIGKPALC